MTTKAEGVEWIGGMVLMLAYVTGEGEPYRPEALFWMGADGAILGSTLARPGELFLLASESLQSTIDQPVCGAPHRPTRVRVASDELADALRTGHPWLDVVCAPTPELDEMLALMIEKMGEDSATELSYLSPDIEPGAMSSFFEAAAELFRAKPWRLVPDDQSLFSVTIEQLGVHDSPLQAWRGQVLHYDSATQAAVMQDLTPSLGINWGMTGLRSADEILQPIRDAAHRVWRVDLGQRR